MTKSIFIDTKNQTITELDINSYEDLRQAVGGLIEELPVRQFPGIVWVNEEGLLDGLDYFFSFRGHPSPVPGNAVIQGEVDDEGDTKDVSITLDQAAQLVRFLTPEQVADWVEANADMPAVSISFTDKDGKTQTNVISTMGDLMDHMRRDTSDSETPDDEFSPK